MKYLSRIMKCPFMPIVMLALFVACQGDQEDPAPNCTGLSVSIDQKTNTGCGTPSGSVSLTVAGGEAPYRYSRDNGTPQSAASFTNLSAGNYTFRVIDRNDCTASVQVAIESTNGVVINTLATDPSGCKEQQGRITVQASAGTPPYQYRLGSGGFQTANIFSGLGAGQHTIVVRDSENCDFTQSTEVLSGVSYSTSIASIISSSCAVSGCHAGTQAPDFRVFANIRASAQNIKTRTGNRTMPQGSTLSQTEIDLIACWVDDGAPQN